MPTLSVSEFSCLKEATFTLAPVNVIIGPQGSGKSITTKLFYFFSDMMTSYVQFAEKNDGIEAYKKFLAKQFCVWFPPPAWGQGRFNITYSAGNFFVRILRRRSQGRLGDEVSVKFSDWFIASYHEASELIERQKANSDIESGDSLQFSEAIDKLWRVKENISRRMGRDLADEYIATQTFIPAGRAYFTSIGRLVAGFEQAGSLDPVTIKFARLFANLRDRKSRSFNYRIERLGPDFVNKRNIMMNELFGGEIRFEDDSEFVETKDGRKIPFSSLSSGQQELLPMWSIMDYYNEIDILRGTSSNITRRSTEIVYIEEPEAHLFPSAQSLLMEFLIGSVASQKRRRNLIITTHSPYIMSKINVFLKAGQLARRKKRNQEINDIVPRECWLGEGQLSALAIEDNKIKNLMDEDGLIDGRYLDQISEEISFDFSRLLEIESEI